MPHQVQDRPHAKRARPPSAAVQGVPAPADVGMWPESDAGVDSTVTTVSREDNAMAQTLEQARRAMRQVSTDGELDIQLMIKRFDQALDSLVADARTSSPDSLLACLRAIHGADEALKGRGALSAPLALERLVLGLAR